MLAIAYASLSRRRGDTQYQDAVRHASSALDHIEAVIHPGSVVGIQAMILLVLYSMLDPHHFNSWYLIGLSSRAMVDIGLHQDPPPELQLKESELDLRRRIYLCVYVLDRSGAASLSCTFFFFFVEPLADLLAWSIVKVSHSQMIPPMLRLQNFARIQLPGASSFSMASIQLYS